MICLINKPVVGITGAYVFHNKFMVGTYVHHDYQKVIAANGGIPIILPFLEENLAQEMVEKCDAILFSGGEDVDPQFYGQDPHQKLGETIPLRDKWEIALLEKAMEKKKPILAICRGIQLVNIALGGSLIQDIPSDIKNSIKHSQTVNRSWDSHWVTLEKGSRLEEILQETKIRVNSLHHQAIDRLAEPLRVTAKSSDGVIEAIEHEYYGNFLLGIQWHPESMAATDEKMNKIFAEFVKSATSR